MPPLFSVIIPAYNAARYLRQTLDSVSLQTLRDFEVVIVDDGSTDNTRDIIRTWAESNSHLVVRCVEGRHEGIGAARNRALRASEGRFAAFLDADDLWLPGKLQRCAEHLSSNPEVDIVGHGVQTIREDSGKPATLFAGPHASFDRLLFRGNCLFTCATMVRRERVLAAGGFSEDMSINGVEDYDMWLRLAQNGCSFSFLREVLSFYRIHPQGISSDIQQCSKIFRVMDRYFKSLSEHSLLETYRLRRQKASMLVKVSGKRWIHGDKIGAAHTLARSLVFDPASLVTMVRVIHDYVWVRSKKHA